MLKVFLVEDESVIREGLKNNIPWEQFGYTVVGEAGDGEMALPLIRKTKPDVLITDIKMPFMDGLSLSKIVSAEFPKTKIIIISGYDDFEYARQAIEVGVEQYLLKPITRVTMKKVLLEIKDKIQQDMEQKDYQLQFQNEMHEYEQFSRRHFFEKIFERELSVSEIYEEASKLSLELNASYYNLLLFSLHNKEANISEPLEFTMKQEEILHYFLKYPHFIVFYWNINSYGVLIKADYQDKIDELTHKGIEHIKSVCEQSGSINWYLAAGIPVERLSRLSECYQSVNHFFAYRFIMPNQNIFTKDSLVDVVDNQQEKKIENVSPSKMNPAIIIDFLQKGKSTEIYEFVDYYLNQVKDALLSNMFRDYIVLNIRFTTMEYIESLGISQEEYWKCIEPKYADMHIKPEDVEPYFAQMLKTAMMLRDEENEMQSKKILRKAMEYIDANFNREDLSLNSVANEVHVSSNYFSAIFSQTMQKTFIEYVTNKRMEHAKHLLKNTDKSSGDIALEVGYKDPHYFSFVFKKTQGCSPREYRTSK